MKNVAESESVIRHHRRRALATLAAFTGAMVCPAAFAATPPRRLTISVTPQFTAVTINRAWAPFLERLSALTGVVYELRHFASIRKFEEGFRRGDTDMAYMDPYHAVTAKRSQGYIPLLHDTTPLTGILVVRTDSTIQSIKQLNGSKIAFPSPNSFGSSLWMRALLGRAGIDFTAQYVNTHQNVYRSVLLGETPAGGGIRSTLTREPEAVRSQLRVLFETPPVAAHPLAMHPRIPATLRERIVTTILAMGAGSDRELLAGVGFEKPVRADYARDYAPLEKYNLERLMVDGVKGI